MQGLCSNAAKALHLNKWEMHREAFPICSAGIIEKGAAAQRKLSDGAFYLIDCKMKCDR